MTLTPIRRDSTPRLTDMCSLLGLPDYWRRSVCHPSYNNPHYQARSSDAYVWFYNQERLHEALIIGLEEQFGIIVSDEVAVALGCGTDPN